jgi:hypothetical protein
MTVPEVGKEAYLSAHLATGDDASTARPSHNASVVDLGYSEKDAGTAATTAAAASTPTSTHDITADMAKDAAEKHGDAEEEDESHYPTGFKLLLICIALCLAVFLVALVSPPALSLPVVKSMDMRSCN